MSGKGQGKGLLLHFKQGKYILVWKYIEKTACIPKFLEKSGQVGRLIQRPQGGGQSRPTVHQAAGKGGRESHRKQSRGVGKGSPFPHPLVRGSLPPTTAHAGRAGRGPPALRADILSPPYSPLCCLEVAGLV